MHPKRQQRLVRHLLTLLIGSEPLNVSVRGNVATVVLSPDQLNGVDLRSERWIVPRHRGRKSPIKTHPRRSGNVEICVEVDHGLVAIRHARLLNEKRQEMAAAAS